MDLNEMLEEGERLVLECRELLSEVQTLLNRTEDKSEEAKLRRILEELSRDNERLYRENIMLKSALKQ